MSKTTEGKNLELHLDSSEGNQLVGNVHEGLPNELESVVCRGQYKYYHYLCDGVQDVGWGCGYRTLQTLCSWVQHQQVLSVSNRQNCDKLRQVPSIAEIQSALVEMGDKPESFRGSRQWIGSSEICLCLDFFFDIPCKILHVPRGEKLIEHMPELFKHFQKFGSPVMMGGETDNSSKGIMGVCVDPPAFLVVDPHYVAQEHQPTTKAKLQASGWARWVQLSELHAGSFYNLCLPQLVGSSQEEPLAVT